LKANNSFYDEQRNKSWDKNLSLCPGHSKLGGNRPSQSELNAYDAAIAAVPHRQRNHVHIFKKPIDICIHPLQGCILSGASESPTSQIP
jgi:hypothetical protein